MMTKYLSSRRNGVTVMALGGRSEEQKEIDKEQDEKISGEIERSTVLMSSNLRKLVKSTLK